MSATLHLRQRLRYTHKAFLHEDDTEKVVISIRITKALLRRLDLLIEKGVYISRSEAIRRGILLVLKENKILAELSD